jgi:hypothetical protein
MPVIPATQKVEIGRIAVGGQPRQKAQETPLNQEKARHGVMHLSSQYANSVKRRVEVQAGSEPT